MKPSSRPRAHLCHSGDLDKVSSFFGGKVGALQLLSVFTAKTSAKGLFCNLFSVCFRSASTVEQLLVNLVAMPPRFMF